MDLYLASTAPKVWLDSGPDSPICKSSALLESFWYWNEWQDPYFAKCPNTIIDSGAFTMMYSKNQKDKYDIDRYCDAYIDFINSHPWVDKYIELDIDSVMGYEKVLQLRRRLESRTGKQCMPVMHVNRSKDDYIAMCKDYDYICLGDMAGTTSSRDMVLGAHNWFVDTAHENNCKVHALGYTSTKNLKFMSFDSCDSSSWTSGGRYARFSHFNGTTIDIINKPSNCVLKAKPGKTHYETIDEYNLLEWLKWQQYVKDFY